MRTDAALNVYATDVGMCRLASAPFWGPGLIYVIGGVAWANVDDKADAGDGAWLCAAGVTCAFPAVSNITKTGWTFGGG